MAEDRARTAIGTVVGIGASAGGLAALRTLLSHLPEDTGLSFVVVVHLAPDQLSHLADLLQLHASMPVRQVTETTRLLANQVYVIPPGSNLSAVDTHLRLSDLEEVRSQRSPIDHFFRTLAATHDGHAIGVVLTGTGSDGTAGLAAIKAGGGLTIVQDPEEAQYDGMPRNALAMGVVDLRLSLADMASHLTQLAQLAHNTPELFVRDDTTLPAETERALQQVLGLVKARTGHDVTGYKESTILRRIRRRMQLHQLELVDAYVELLRNDQDEVERLFNDMLISVTSFFRDAEVFAGLEDQIVPELFKGKAATDVVRVWSIGCATGEEAYSIAILLLEHAAAQHDPPQLQLFASDLHQLSLLRAREGVYPSSIEADVSPERLARFFISDNGGYRIRQEVRDMVVFAPHGLLTDPPFSHLDLISCRNLLIYLQREVQQQAISTFHYALDPGGFLVLGTSESLDRSDLFTTVDKHHCFFRRRAVATREQPVPVFLPPTSRVTRRTELPRARTTQNAGYGSLHAELAERYAPPSILVDAEHRIVHYSTHAGRYLSQPGGEPTTDVFRLIRDELRLELHTALHAAQVEQRTIVGRPQRTTIEGESMMVAIRVTPTVERELENFVLVFFDEFQDAPGSPAGLDADLVDPSTVEQLAAELDLTRSRLQRTIQHDETSREEMKAANEELQSTNEELRSTMEELETSKEELQSTNEELATLNQENRHRVEELAMLSNDLQNLLTATDIATLFLDRQLRIVRFTPPVTALFNVSSSDRGRPLMDFTHRLVHDDLLQDARRVLERLIPVEVEIQSTDGRWLLTRILPYRSSEDRIEGVVVTFVDITRRLEAELSLRASERRLRLALDANAMGSWSWHSDGQHADADDRAFAILGMSPGSEDFVAALESCVVAEQRSDVRRRLWVDSPGSAVFRVVRRDDRRVIVVELHARPAPIRADAGEERFSIGTIQDVTTRVETTQALAQRSERLALLSDAAARLLRGFEPGRVVNDLFVEVSDLLQLEVIERYEPVGSGLQLMFTNEAAAASGRSTAGEDGVGLGLTASLDAAQRREVRVFNDIPASTSPLISSLQGAGLTAYASFPLLVNHRLLGVISFGTRGPRRLDDDAVELIRTVVDYLAVAEQRLHAESELRQLNQTLESTVLERTVEIRRREEQFRALVDASSQAVWLADDAGNVEHSMPDWSFDEDHTLVWPPGGWVRTLHPEDRERAQRAWALAVGARQPLELDVRLGDDAPGWWRWTTVRAVALTDREGTRGWVGMILDIEERVRAEQQLRSVAANITRAEQQERERIRGSCTTICSSCSTVPRCASACCARRRGRTTRDPIST